MVQWGWISKLYHYPTYASFALDNGFATYKGAFLGVGFDRCINPAPGSPLRGTRPSRHQTIEAKAHCENDPANPKDRLDQPDQPTLSMSNRADGLIVSHARDRAAIHNLEDASFGPGCGVRGLI